MFDIWYTDRVTDYARALVGNGRFGRRGIAAGSPQQQVTGLIGQVVLHDIFGLPWPTDRGRGDGGVDLEYHGLTLDVKTQGRTTAPRRNYVSAVQRAQIRFPTEVLVFCSLYAREETLTVCGWIAKPQFLDKAEFCPAGSWRVRSDGTKFRLKGDLYEIQIRNICNSDTFEDLTRDLRLIAEA